MHVVYRKQAFPDGSNAHGVDRTERWTFVKDKEFDTPREALEHAKAQNRKHSLAVNLWHGSKQHLDDFLTMFTTDDRYLLQRVYYVGEVPKEKLRAALAEAGITYEAL